jgi:hypothetical protein
MRAFGFRWKVSINEQGQRRPWPAENSPVTSLWSYTLKLRGRLENNCRTKMASP